MSRQAAVRRAIVAALLLMAPGIVSAQPLQIETRAHRSFADVGESGAAYDVAAVISVLVTRNGVPVANLGSSVPMSGGMISLPAPWSLTTSFTAPPGPLGIGCVLSPTSFANRGKGIYTISVVPWLFDPICRWGLGDYHYVVRITSGTLRGSALGVLTIPDTPSEP